MKEEDHLDLSRVEWHHVLPRMGIDEKLIANPKRRGPCPICGGKSRFRFTNEKGRGTWLCNCGSGDGVRLIALVNGISDARAIIDLRELILGPQGVDAKYTRTAPIVDQPCKTPAEIEKARASLRRAWSKGKKIQGTLSWSYLEGRVPGLQPQWISSDFHHHERLYHLDEDLGKKGHYPALLSLVRDAANPRETVTIHRTYLDPRGGKARVSPGQEKKLMTAVIDKIHGHSIRLNNAEGSVVVVTEGIENGLSWVAAMQNQVPVYAAVNCHNMARFRWPQGTKVLVICGDHDPVNPKTGLRPGFHNAMLLKERAIKEGLIAVVRIPRVQGIDWDDMWKAGEAEHFRFSREPRTAELATS